MSEDRNGMTPKDHDELVNEIMQRVMSGDTSQYAFDVGYLKGRLKGLLDFVKRVAAALPTPEDRANDASDYHYEVLEELVEEARKLLEQKEPPSTG